MAGYSKGIVATRKLNEKNKARLRDSGDTEFGFIKGRLSHINKDEKAQLTAADAYDISLRERVESDIADKGAGTINPFTGMPEYHKGGALDFIGHPMHHDWYWTGKGDPSKSPEAQQKKQEDRQYQQIERQYGSGQLSYDELAGMDPKKFETYLKGKFDIGEDSMDYIGGFEKEPFGFLGEQQTLTTGRAGEIRGFTERGLQSAYSTTMGALGSQEKGLRLEREGLGLKTRGFDIQEEGLADQQAALGRTTGRGYAQATGATATAASRSGLATSGTITQGLETQKKQLFQDYTAGTRDIGRQRAGVQIGREGVDIAGRGLDIAMADIGRERGTALDTLTLGQDIAGADYDFAVSGADLDKRQAEYIEKKRQLDQMYADITSIPA